jgi:hypothetical protein
VKRNVSNTYTFGAFPENSHIFKIYRHKNGATSQGCEVGTQNSNSYSSIFKSPTLDSFTKAQYVSTIVNLLKW